MRSLRFGPSARISTPAPGPSTIGSFASNASAPQFADYALVAGFVLFVAAAGVPQGQANAAEYQYGTHATAIHAAEGVKSFVQQSVRTPPAAATPMPLRSLWAAPESIDLSIGGWAVSNAQAPQGPVPQTIVQGQADSSQSPSSIWKSAPAPVVVATQVASFVSIPPQSEERPTRQVFQAQSAGNTPRPIAPTSAAPQLADLTLQAQFTQALKTPQGAVPALTVGASQADLTQGSSWVKASQPAPTVVSSPVATFLSAWEQPYAVLQPSLTPSQPAPTTVVTAVAPFVAAAPGIEDRQTQQVWPAKVAGSVPSVIQSLWAAPQLLDLTQQALFIRPAITQAVFGPVPPFIYGWQQEDPSSRVGQPTIYQSSVTPPVVIASTFDWVIRVKRRGIR